MHLLRPFRKSFQLYLRHLGDDHYVAVVNEGE